MRVVRVYENKQAEVFYLILKDTVEESWFQNSHKNDRDYITIDEEGLEKVLKGEVPNPYNRATKELMFRF